MPAVGGLDLDLDELARCRHRVDRVVLADVEPLAEHLNPSPSGVDLLDGSTEGDELLAGHDQPSANTRTSGCLV